MKSACRLGRLTIFALSSLNFPAFRADHSRVSAFVDEWTPRIGEEASRLQLRGTRLLLGGGALCTGWIVAAVLGMALHDGLLGTLGVALLATGVALLVVGAMIVNRSLRSMSQFLGVKVERSNAPRLHDDAFRHWCRAHGLQVPGA